MMTQFKVDDVVHHITNKIHKRIITRVYGNFVDVQEVNGSGHWKCRSKDDYVLVVNPNEEAIRLLEAQGFTITPPEPKLTGKIVVYTVKGSTGIFSQNKKDWDDRELGSSRNRTVVALINWTEGDGL